MTRKRQHRQFASRFAAVVVMVLSFLSVRSVAWADPGSAINPAIPAEDLNLAPPGANDWNCKPTEAHPRPVILVHGTAADMGTTWKVLSPELKAEGYCVFALNYGGATMMIPPFRTVYGVTDIRLSARQLAQFVDIVLSRTGASQVDIVGHSQGGTLARQYLKFEGGANSADPAANKVLNLVTLGATNHGTTWAGDILQRLYEIAVSIGFGNESVYQFFFGVAMSQQTVGSPLLQDLNAGGDTEAGVRYTVIASRTDNMVTPPEGTFLSTSGRASHVDNVWVQDGCPSEQTTHTSLTFDARSLHLVKVGLDPSYAEGHPAPCGS